MLCRVNANVGGLGAHGEIVDLNPDWWRAEIEAGYLAPLDPPDPEPEPAGDA